MTALGEEASSLQTQRTEEHFATKKKEGSSPGLMFCESCRAAANMLATDSRN